MTTGTQTAQDTRAALEARRATLALAVAEGDRDAVQDLEAVEGALLRLRVGDERRALAEHAKAERDQAEAQRAEAERRRILEARFAELEGQRLEAARKVDAAADIFCEALKGLASVGETMYRTRLELGENRPRLRLGEMIAAFVQWRVVPYAPTIGRPDHYYRRPLAEVLGGAPEAPAA
jgi:hypothetical protein